VSPAKPVTDADLSALERELERMQAHLAETEEALEELARKQAEVAGTATSMRESVGELERDLAAKRQKLARAERERATRAFEKTVGTRDELARRLASRLVPVLEDIRALDAARSEAASAHETLKQLDGPRRAEALPPEPTELTEQWKRLIARVATELDDHLADELLDVAARSPLGHAIDDLPAHLHEAARQRRRSLLNEARAREHDGRPSIRQIKPARRRSKDAS
jgi:chromosome segregation ATPase